MYILLASMVALNVAVACRYAAPFFSGVARQVVDCAVDRKTRQKLGVLAYAAEVFALRKVGYYGSIRRVYALRSGSGPREDVTRRVLAMDPSVCNSEFVTSSGFFFHELQLGRDAVLEFHGLDDWGKEYHFVADWDAKIAIPLKFNLDNDKLVDKTVINAIAQYGEHREDVTALVRSWTRCCGIERVLPFVGRAIFAASETLQDAVAEAEEEDRFELHLMYHDLSTRKVSVECDAKLLLLVS